MRLGGLRAQSGTGGEFIGLEARPLDDRRQQPGLGGILGQRGLKDPQEFQKFGDKPEGSGARRPPSGFRFSL